MVWKVKLLEKLKGFNYLKQERGSILVLVVLLLPIMFGCLGFAYDFGNLYMHRARLQNVADAAALAGARAYLDSQATDSKDNIDGTVVKTSESASGQLAPDSRSTDRTGRPAEYAYIASVANVKNPPSITHGDSQHPAADKAADDYIFKNIINLGNEVKSDKWSHYALNSNGDNPKTFYRVGLSEEVRLYFLPIIKNVPKTQTVRVGAIALVVPETTTEDPGSGGSGSNSGVINPSIFDNLFTFSEWLFTRNLTENNGTENDTISGTVKSSFTGAMVYTHLNNAVDEASDLYNTWQPGTFFHYETNNGSVSDQTPITHMYEDAINSTVSSSSGTINDPYIDTFYDTKAYLEAFRSKLEGDHIEVTTSAAKVELKASDINEESSYLYSKEENLTINGMPVYQRTNGNKEIYARDGNDYYLVNKTGNNYSLTTVQSGDNSYNVCYHELPYHSNKRLFKCTKIDSNYFLLNENGGITNIYINGDKAYINRSGGVPDPNRDSFVGLYNGSFTYANGVDQWGNVNWTNEKVNINDVTHHLFPTEDAKCSVEGYGNFFNDSDKQYYATVSVPKLNIIHIPLNYKVNNDVHSHSNVDLVFDEELEVDEDNPDTPLYILIDGIGSVEIKGTASTTGRPVIIVFLSEDTKQIKYEFKGEEFIGTIYAPISTFEHVNNLGGTFRGNIIGKTINIQAGSGITWIKENHLEKYEYEKNLDGTFKLDAKGNKIIKYQKDANGNDIPVYAYKDDAIKAVSDEIAKKIEKANKETDLTDDIKKEIYKELGLTDAEVSAMSNNANWYNEQLFARKKQLYTNWRSLYDKYSKDPTKSHLLNFLWPWNEHFDITTEGGDSNIIGEKLRLINFRTEYQEKNPDGTKNNGEKDPFIYLSIEGKSY